MLNQDAKEILSAVIESGEAIADGIQVSDIGVLKDIAQAVFGWEEGLDHLKDTLAQNPWEVYEYVEEEFELPQNEKLEAVVEKGIGLALNGYDFVLAIKAMQEGSEEESADNGSAESEE